MSHQPRRHTSTIDAAQAMSSPNPAISEPSMNCPPVIH